MGLGTLVKAFNDLKASVKALEDKVDNTHKEEIKENQKKLEDLYKANSESMTMVKMQRIGLKYKSDCKFDIL